MTSTFDTLKQAVQALREAADYHAEHATHFKGYAEEKVQLSLARENSQLAAALEAMAEQVPYGIAVWDHIQANPYGLLIPQKHYRESDWPEQRFSKIMLYAAPIATPEHDAQARSAILREAAEIAANHPSKDARAFASSVLNHFSDEHDPQVRNAALEEAAKVADRTSAAAQCTKDVWRHVEDAADEIAAAIRALKTTGGEA